MGGSITFSVGHHTTDDVHVNVDVHYAYETDLERVCVCELERYGGKHGVGIFVSRHSLNSDVPQSD